MLIFGKNDGIALKDEEVGCVETDFNTFKSKAKEIITGLLNCFPYDMSEEELDVGDKDMVEKAEQFLKEIE